MGRKRFVGLLLALVLVLALGQAGAAPEKPAACRACGVTVTSENAAEHKVCRVCRKHWDNSGAHAIQPCGDGVHRACMNGFDKATHTALCIFCGEHSCIGTHGANYCVQIFAAPGEPEDETTGGCGHNPAHGVCEFGCGGCAGVGQHGVGVCSDYPCGHAAGTPGRHEKCTIEDGCIIWACDNHVHAIEVE